MEIRRKVKAASEKSSDSALRVVLIVWALVCFAIFYHVWSTIQRGADHLAAQSDELSVPASEAILNTFRAQKRDTM
jgi:hypothetical protein